jgi:phytoene synthase
MNRADDPMRENHQHCESLVRAHDRDRYIATLFAPAEHRGALFALYAFAVEIARVRDAAREALPGEIRLQWWREALQGLRDGEAAAHPVAAALREMLGRYGFVAEPLVELIDARTFDLYDEPMATLAELELYAIRTQSPVFARPSSPRSTPRSPAPSRRS